MTTFNSKIPEGPLEKKWDNHRFQMKLVNPANRRKFKVLVVGTGLAGSSSAATLSEMGYNVDVFCLQDSPRRAHSIAAQGGINAAKNYPADGDSVWRLFYDTIKGGDYRAREANVYRLASLSNNIIDQCVAQGVPFAREYGGQLSNRSFGGAQVSRTFFARGQTGQQLLLGAYGALMKEASQGKVKIHARQEMMELVVHEGKARGIITRNLVTGLFEKHLADVVILASGGYGNVYYLSTNAMASNASAIWRAHKKGAYFANPCFTQIHPTCIPISGDHQSKLTLMRESLRNDGRVWVPKNKNDKRSAQEIPEAERDYYLERIYPSFGNLVPRDVASRQAKFACDEGRGVGSTGLSVYLDFEEAIKREGKESIEKKYGNLFEMYERITDENPYKTPMRIYPAIHYTMGGLWVDYNLMSNIAGLFVLGEANFSDHGANRLGASALMQGLADGYFIAPATVSDYLATHKFEKIDERSEVVEESLDNATERMNRLININGKTTPKEFHKRLGHIMWEHVGMSRSEKSLTTAISQIKDLQKEFWQDLKVVGDEQGLSQEIEKASRVADYLEFGELLAKDALERKESCGGHFREESQTSEGEAQRNDKDFQHVALWDEKGNRHTEDLHFENVKLSQRSYK